VRAAAEKHKDSLAALMVTYPSTHGVYEDGIDEICQVIHDNGGQVYMDGANMNAQVGLTSPGYIGADVAYHGYREQEKGGDVKRAVAHATTFQVCVCVGATPQQQRRPGPHAPSSSSLQRVPLRTPTSQFVTQPCATQKLG
jgi:hypothetical protein